MTKQGLKTTDIKGKGYVEVNQRVKFFNENYKDHILLTEMVSNENGVVIFKASIYNQDDKLIRNAFAYEKEGSNFINKTSYIENCETSAVGRVLGFMNIGIDTSIASADEVANAIQNQNNTKTDNTITMQQIENIANLIKQSGTDEKKFLAYFKVNSIDKLPYDKAIQALNNKIKKAS